MSQKRRAASSRKWPIVLRAALTMENSAISALMDKMDKIATLIGRD
jgi:hypothetical protein